MGNSSPKYPDSHRDEQVFCSVPAYSMRHRSSKYRDLQEGEKWSSNVSSNSLDRSSLKYLDSQRHKKLKVCEFNSDYGFGPLYKESDSSTEENDSSTEESDSSSEESDSSSEESSELVSDSDAESDYGENDSPPEYDWRFNLNCDAGPYYEEKNSDSEESSGLVSDSEENNSPLKSDWRLNSNNDVGPYYEENDSTSEESSKLVSDSDTDPGSEENDSPPKSVWRFNTNCNDYEEKNSDSEDSSRLVSDSPSKSGWRFNSNGDAVPYYEEKDSASEESSGLVSSSDNDYDSEKCSLLHKYKSVDENHLMLPNSEQSFSKTKFDITKHLSEKNEHSILLQFYEKLLDDLMEKFSIGYFDVCSSLQHMIRSHGDVVNGRLPSETDYCDKSFCLGYLHRYAACHSVMVSDSVSTILKSSPSNILSSKLNVDKLNVMFLGGGPGNDFVGFLTALHSYRHHLLDLDVTVVDKMSGWEDVFNETVKKLKQCEYGQFYRLFNDVNITSSFLTANLKNCEEWSIDMQTKLKRADHIFLVKVLSHISNDDKLGVLENIIFYMKPGAVLIYVDHPYPNKAFASVSRSLRPVYRSKIKRYNLKAKMLRFGYRNTTRCTAEVRVFQRR